MINPSKNTYPASSRIKRMTCSLLIIVTIAATFISCFDGIDIEFENITFGMDHWDDVHFSGIPMSEPEITIRIDSMGEKNDSTLRLWVHVNYDSVIIRSTYGVSYAKTGDTQALTKIFSVEPDTIDFRNLTNLNYIYDLDLETDSLKSKANYSFCPFMDYIVKGDTIRLSAASIGGECFFFEAK